MASASDRNVEWRMPVGEDTPSWLRRLAPHLERLSLRRRLHLIDVLKSGATLELDAGVRLTLHSEYELRRVAKSGPADQAILDWVRSFAPGDVFYDVGANTGLFSLLTGRLHEGRVAVFAFEPAFGSFEALVRNVIANGLSESVHALPLALYAETGLRPFHYRRLEAGAAKHGIDVPIDAKSRELFAPVVSQSTLTMTIDAFVSTFGAAPPVHLKIDVDGHEARVLEGAAHALATSVRTLCVEAVQSDPDDRRPEELIARAAAAGFTVRHVLTHHEDRFPRAFDYVFARD